MTDPSLSPADLLDPAPQAAVRTAARRLAGKLGRRSQQRLDILLGLMGKDGRIGYLDAYDRLFPDHRRSEADKQKADKAFSKFRRTLHEIAADHEVRLALKVDGRRSADPANRRFRFVAADDPGERIAKFSHTATQAVTGFPQQDQRAAVRGAELTCLLVYAERDREPAQALITAISARLRAAGYNWDLRDYRYVPPGEPIDETRLRKQRSADLTLFLLGPELIADLRSDHSFRTDRPLIPLALHHIEDAHLEDTVLAGRSIFRDRQGRAWV